MNVFSSAEANATKLQHIFCKDVEDEDGSECLLSFIAQLNPSGWIWETCGYQQAFLKEVRRRVVVVL